MNRLERIKHIIKDGSGVFTPSFKLGVDLFSVSDVEDLVKVVDVVLEHLPRLEHRFAEYESRWMAAQIKNVLQPLLEEEK